MANAPELVAVAQALFTTVDGSSEPTIPLLVVEVLLLHAAWVNPDAESVVVMENRLTLAAARRLLQYVISDARFTALPRGADPDRIAHVVRTILRASLDPTHELHKADFVPAPAAAAAPPPGLRRARRRRRRERHRRRRRRQRRRRSRQRRHVLPPPAAAYRSRAKAPAVKPTQAQPPSGRGAPPSPTPPAPNPLEPPIDPADLLLTLGMLGRPSLAGRLDCSLVAIVLGAFAATGRGHPSYSAPAGPGLRSTMAQILAMMLNLGRQGSSSRGLPPQVLRCPAPKTARCASRSASRTRR